MCTNEYQVKKSLTSIQLEASKVQHYFPQHSSQTDRGFTLYREHKHLGFIQYKLYGTPHRRSPLRFYLLR